MLCPHCAATAAAEQPKRTVLGYRTFRCPQCRRTFNERTGTPFNHLQVPTDIVLLVVLWRLRYKLRLRDLTEMFLDRGFVFSHEAVREWEARFAPLLADRLRAKRRSTAGSKWHADETYVRVNGTWCSRYRAIDREGNLDALLSEQRDMAAAQRCFAQALAKHMVISLARFAGRFWRYNWKTLLDKTCRTSEHMLSAGGAPEQVTTDGHDAYPRALRETLGPGVRHRTSRYKNNRIEQDHRGVKQRSSPMRGFGSVVSAARCCTAFEEQRQYFRARARPGEPVSLAERRRRFQERWATVMAELAAA